MFSGAFWDETIGKWWFNQEKWGFNQEKWGLNGIYSWSMIAKVVYISNESPMIMVYTHNTTILYSLGLLPKLQLSAPNYMFNVCIYNVYLDEWYLLHWDVTGIWVPNWQYLEICQRYFIYQYLKIQYLCIYIYIQLVFTHMNALTHAHTHAHTYTVYIYIYIYTHIYIYTDVCLFVWAFGVGLYPYLEATRSFVQEV